MMGAMDGVIFLAFILFFLVLLFAFYTSSGSAAVQDARARRARRRQQLQISEAARQAMARAGYEASSDYVQVADLGLLAYRYANEPKLVRGGAVLMDTRYLRPFADLLLPYPASGEVRFELIDGEGRLRYADEAQYDLDGGRNTIVPGTWLPLEGKGISRGEWTLRLLAGDTLLAVHRFGWQPVGGGVIQRYIASDGELSDALQQALAARQRQAVSLSELLADQEEQPPARARFDRR